MLDKYIIIDFLYFIRVDLMSYLDSIVSAVHYDKFTWGPNYISNSSTWSNDDPPISLIVTKGEQFGQTADWSVGLTQDRRLGSQYIGRAKQTDQLSSTKLFEVLIHNFHLHSYLNTYRMDQKFCYTVIYS